MNYSLIISERRVGGEKCTIAWQNKETKEYM